MNPFVIELKLGQPEYGRYRSGLYCKSAIFKYKIELIFDEMITKWSGCVWETDQRCVVYPGLSMQYQSLSRFVPTLQMIKLEFQRSFFWNIPSTDLSYQ